MQGPANVVSSTKLAATMGRGTAFGIMAGLVQMGTRFLTVPIVIGYLGLDGYGIWSIIMVAAGYMRFGTAGVKSAYQKYVADATSNNDFIRVNMLLSTGSALILVFSIIGLIPMVVFSRDLAMAIGVPDKFLESTVSAIILLALVMTISNVGGVFEAVVMGGHRIDLARQIRTVFTILEAAFIISVLHMGYGLIAMTITMATSEIGYMLCCFFWSRRILPVIQVSVAHVSRKVVRELVRFAGSYQLVNILEILNGVILAVSVLKLFGADSAGVVAASSRIVMAALLPQESFLLPVLSIGSALYASGSNEQIQQLIRHSLKTTGILAMIPLAFVASYGSVIMYVWTGLDEVSAGMVIWLMCLGGICASFARVAFILYRTSGRIWFDNLRQMILLSILLVLVYLGHKLGLVGVLGGLAIAQAMGMILMFTGLKFAFGSLFIGGLTSDVMKLLVVSLVAMLISGIVAGMLPQWSESMRLTAALNLGVIFTVFLAMALTTLLFTGTLSKSEMHAMVRSIKKTKHLAM